MKRFARALPFTIGLFTALATLVTTLRLAGQAGGKPMDLDTAASPLAAEPAPSTVMPEVADPALLPVAPARRVLHTWDEALTLLREQAPGYLSSVQAVLRAEAEQRIARSALLPTLTGQGSYTHQFFTEPTNFGGRELLLPLQDVLGVSGQLSVPIVQPRGLYAVGTAGRILDVSRRTLEAERRELVLDLVSTMLATLAGQRVADLNREGLRAALERVELVRARVRFGQSPELDIDRAEQDVASARSALISGDEALLQAREQLAVLLGSEVPIAAGDDLDLAQFERAIVETCHLQSDIEAQPQVALSRARLVVAERAVEDANLRFAPSLSLVSQASYQNKVQLGPRGQWNVQGVLTLPLYDGGARYGASAEARAAVAAAREDLIAARVRAITGVRRASRGVTVSEASRGVARQQLDLAQRVDRRIRDGYSHGVGTSLDLVLSAQALRQAATSVALLEFEVGKARVGAVLANAECAF